MLFCQFVVPHAGTWIEIKISIMIFLRCTVVPHAGTWIEIMLGLICRLMSTSFPTRERGLKFRHWTISQQSAPVVPNAGTWIEISTKIRPSISFLVVPHAGTWIEIGVRFGHVLFHTVVPHAGTWIEITSPSLSVVALQCRSPRGNVD